MMQQALRGMSHYVPTTPGGASTSRSGAHLRYFAACQKKMATIWMNMMMLMTTTKTIAWDGVDDSESHVRDADADGYAADASGDMRWCWCG